MNYKIINESIIKWVDVPSNIIKDNDFYNYLLDNRVAYYYCSQISTSKNSVEEKIIKAWDNRNAIFYKSLEKLDELCKKNNIEFLLYKTYKYYWEVIWWDIDIIVKKEDFYKILEVFDKEWWYTEEDEPWKWKCEKEWYITIEPHVTISWNWNNIISKDELWKNPTLVEVNGKTYKDVGLDKELLSIYMKVLYEPSYLDLYDFLLIHNQNIWFEQIKKYITNSEERYMKKINNFNIYWKFPLFLNSIDILSINLLNYFNRKFFNKRMFIHNIYWKNRYKINSKLPYLTKYINL
jgi:hypothetical protein